MIETRCVPLLQLRRGEWESATPPAKHTHTHTAGRGASLCGRGRKTTQGKPKQTKPKNPDHDNKALFKPKRQTWQFFRNFHQSRAYLFTQGTRKWYWMRVTVNLDFDLHQTPISASSHEEVYYHIWKLNCPLKSALNIHFKKFTFMYYVK